MSQLCSEVQKRELDKRHKLGVSGTMGLDCITKSVSREQNTGHEVEPWALQYKKFRKKMKKNAGRRMARSYGSLLCTCSQAGGKGVSLPTGHFLELQRAQ